MDKYLQYVRVFNHFDGDGDGKVSPSELQQCVGCLRGEITLEESTAAVELMDTDGDGLLCLEDFIRLVEGGEEEVKDKDLREAFKMYELEGRGYIDPMSLKKMLCRFGESKSIDDCKKMIAYFDINGDGVLTFDEFKVMMS